MSFKGSHDLKDEQSQVNMVKATIMQTFHQCDEGHKGYLSREDLGVASVTLLGYKPSKFEVDDMMGSKDDLVNKQIGIERFVRVMSQRMASVDEDEEIRNTFLAFDSQCRGFLTVVDLKRVFAEVAPHLSQHSIEAAFREIDRDADGRVSYKDFDFMMKYSLEDGF